MLLPDVGEFMSHVFLLQNITTDNIFMNIPYTFSHHASN